MRIRRKLDKPFDVSALETKVEKWVAETKQRKARRRAKRIRVGLPVGPEETDEEEHADVEYPSDTSSSEAIEEDLTALDAYPRPQTGARHRKKSSSSTTIKSEHEGARIPLRQQKTNGHPVSTPQRRLRRKSTTPDGDSETADEFPRRHSPTEEPLIQARQIRKPEATHELNQTPSGRSSYSSKDPKQVQDNDTTNQSLNRTKSQPHAKPLADHEKSLPKIISSLPKSSGSAGTNLGQAGRGPARLGQARKSAFSSKKPRVTGAAIFGNWAAKIKTRKPLAFRQEIIREDVDKSRAFGKLSVKRRYEKAGRYEPAPNPDDLTFVNLKDGRPIKKPSSILTPIPYRTPFQMIQDGLAQANKTASTSTGDIDMVDLPQGKSDFNMGLDAKWESPQNIESGGRLMQSGYTQGNSETPSLARTSAQASRRGSAPPAIQPQPAAATFADQAPFAPFEARGSLSGWETEQAPILARPSLPAERSGQIVVAPRQEKLFPPSVGGASVWNERREPSRHNPVDRPSVGTTERVEMQLENPDTMQRFPLMILRADTGYHQSLPNNIYNSYQHEHKTLEHLSDVLGTILIGLEHTKIADVRFRGLNRACKQLFMRIKVPPRQMHVWCKYICTAEDFRKYFHTVGDLLVVKLSIFVLTFDLNRRTICITEPVI